MYIKSLCILFTILVLSSCSSTGIRETPTQEPEQKQGRTYSPRPSPKPTPEPLDIRKVETALNTSNLRKIGFTEKRFNPCKLGISKSRCYDHFLSIVNFRVLCRASEGTVEHVSNYELQPLKSPFVWRLGLIKGLVETDFRGNGRISAITPGTSRRQRFVLIQGKRSLGLRAHSVSRIIVPADWCR